MTPGLVEGRVHVCPWDACGHREPAVLSGLEPGPVCGASASLWTRYAFPDFFMPLGPDWLFGACPLHEGDLRDLMYVNCSALVRWDAVSSREEVLAISVMEPGLRAVVHRAWSPGT